MLGESSAATGVVVQKLRDTLNRFQVYDYFRPTQLFGGPDKRIRQEAEQLHKTLGKTLTYLKEVENDTGKLFREWSVKIWLRKVKVLALEADKIIGGYLYPKGREEMLPFKDKVLSYLSTSNDMALKIKQINKDFESINKEATGAGHRQSSILVASSWSSWFSFETDSFTLDPIFIGRDREVSEIVEKLTETWSDGQKFSILAIVGMAGMGKTCLTKEVLNHEMAKARFGSVIWVRVSEIFNSTNVLKKILSTFISNVGTWSKNAIMGKLKEALKDKTYVVVLDDIQSFRLGEWEDFINSISGVTSTEGNAIIMTARSDHLTSIVMRDHIYPLHGLSDEECWSIIKAKAFEDGDISSKFEVTGRKIAQACRGSPFAANEVGGKLSFSESENFWCYILETQLSLVEGDKDIFITSRSSYDSLLSSSLKMCFIYCSIFPKGQVIVKQKLIEMWMAEGFLKADRGNEEMESVGNKFFNELLDKSLLEIVSKDDDGNVWSCRLQDLVHDFASYLLGMGGNDSNGFNHIPEESARYFRTLFFSGKTSGTMFSDFISLRNLTLAGCDTVEELPSEIRKMIHLRYLDISSSSIKNLPEWIGELRHLQTLRADTLTLKELPSSLKYLTKLRHLYINGDVELPAEIGKLTCLQNLKIFRVGYEKGHRIEELGKLNNLKGILEIWNLEKVRNKKEAMTANMFQKQNLCDLKFQWSTGYRKSESNDEDVLDGLQPHANLKKLEISGFNGKRFPIWFEQMSAGDGPPGKSVPLDNLMEITLYDCWECEQIRWLQRSSNVESLHLARLKKVNSIMCRFTKLKWLHVNGLEGLACLPDSLFSDNLNLSKLEIIDCPKLRELPGGLHALISLELLIVEDCPNLKSIGDPSGRGQSHGILSTLSIERCGGLMELPHEMVESWAPTLKNLSLKELSSLENLPMVIDCLAESATSLTTLTIVGVPKFMATRSIESQGFHSLREIEIDVSTGEWSRHNTVAIKETVEGMLHGCSWNNVTKLELRGMEDWESIPESIQHFTALSFLKLENIGVEELPEWFGNLSSLRMLDLRSCSKLRRLPAGDAHKALTKLQSLDIERCPELYIGSEWFNIPHLHINVDGRWIKSRIQYLTDALVKGLLRASSSSSLPAVEPPNKNVAATEKKPRMETHIDESSSELDTVFSKIFIAGSNSSSISMLEILQQIGYESVKEEIIQTKPSLNGIDSQQRVESESDGEIQAVDDITPVTDVEKYSDELQETVISSTNAAERSMHREESSTESVCFQEEGHYLVFEENNHLQLKLENNQIISIGDCASPSTDPRVKAMLRLEEQNLHELSENPNYSNSLILFLQRNKRLAHIADSFFDAMPELRFLDMSDTKIRILPSSLFKRSKLKVLLMRNCLCLETLPPEIGKLLHLEMLDLSGTELYDLPDEIGQLEHMRRMNLSFYGPDAESEYKHLPTQLVSPTFLSKLTEMEALSIVVHPEDHRWTETVACMIHDMSKLEKLRDLQFYFPEEEKFENFIETSPSWKEKSLIKFAFTVGPNVKGIASRVPGEVESLFSQEERCLRYVDGDKTSLLLKSVLARVTSFYLDHHNQVESLSDFDISNFSELKFCVLRECPKLHTILDEKTEIVAFPCLEYLGIFFLWELKHIFWMPPPQAAAGRWKRIFRTPTPLKNKNFEALRHLIIKTCPKLEFILWESMLQCLTNLEELVVEDCERVANIIKEENKKVKNANNALSRLKKLVLRYLPELVSLGNGVCLSEEMISFHECPKLVFKSHPKP